jgi:hypothetical protein
MKEERFVSSDREQMYGAQYKPYRIVDESDVAFVGSLVTKKTEK